MQQVFLWKSKNIIKNYYLFYFPCETFGDLFEIVIRDLQNGFVKSEETSYTSDFGYENFPEEGVDPAGVVIQSVRVRNKKSCFSLN